MKKERESVENYLASILDVQKANGKCFSVDVAHDLQFSKASVSVAMKKLRENGYIEMDAENFITLTASGSRIAKRIYSRHQTLTRLLVQFGVSQETAEKDACKIEHDISDETFSAIRTFMKEK